MNFKKLLALALAIICVFTMLTSCKASQKDNSEPTDQATDETQNTEKESTTDIPPTSEEEQPKLPYDVELKNLGQDLTAAGIGNGKFEGDTTSENFTVTYISGTENAYKYDDSKKTLTFSALSADTVYSVSGKLNGNIIIDVGENYTLNLELASFSLRSSSANPILINSGKEVLISAKKDTKNYIYDERSAITTTEENAFSGSIHSKTNLTVCGNGELFVQSASNNGIQTDTDLSIKELSLVVECNDKALNGKNNVTIENCSTLLVAKSGDAIKTEASNIPEGTEKQNGNVSILGGTHNIFASNDGIEAACDVTVDYGSYVDEATKETKTVATVLNVYTDKYSPYTSPTAHDTPEIDAKVLYVCHTKDEYKYSVKLSNEDGTKSEWVNPTFHESIASGRRTYYTYKFYAKPEYTKMQVFVYNKDQVQQSEKTFELKSDIVNIDSNNDTYRYSSRRWEWKTYSSLSQQGGTNSNSPANPNAVSYSAKGIKGTNAITVKGGAINITSVDNAISADNKFALDSGKAAAGNITVSGGEITAKTLCNGLNSGGALTVNNGIIKILEAYEGIKGNTITVNDGDISVISANNGFNSIAKSGTGITIAGGKIYIYSGAYGISASSSASYTAVLFNGGNIAIIAPESGKSAIYSKEGYTYKDGIILAILNKDGNRESSTHYYSFSHIGKYQDIDLLENTYASVEIDGEPIVSVKIPKTFSSTVVFLSSKIVQISSYENLELTTDANGVYWNE